MPIPRQGGCVAEAPPTTVDRRKGKPVRHRLLLPVAALLVGAAAAGCSDDQPAVCTSIDEFESSIKGLAELELTGTTNVGGLEDQMALIAQDYNQLKDDASEEYDDQVGAINADLEELKTNAAAFEDSPSETTVAALKTSRDAVVTGVDALADDVKSTC
jgi:hypothetical protein